MIAATTYAAGEQINLFAGVRLTRLAQAAALGDTELVVERSLGMDAKGVVVVDNITYSYGSVRDGALSDLAVATPQGTLCGVQAAHALNAVVTDATRDYSALDAVRRSFFVSTAQGADLAVLGRILGVPWAAAIPDDDSYRQVIQAVAYSPRTTRLALTQALDAIVGPGNYVLSEDPTEPATVFCYIDGADLLGEVPEGKTYLSGEVQAVAANGALTLPGPALSVQAVHLAQSRWWAQLKELPSTVKVTDPASFTDTPLSYVGDETTVKAYVVGPGTSAWQLTGQGYYSHHAGLTDAATFDAGVQLVVPDAGKLSASDGRSFGLMVRTETLAFGAGLVLVAPGILGVGLANLAGSGALYAGVAAQVPQNSPFELHICRNQVGDVSLVLDGKKVQSLPAAMFAQASTEVPPGLAVGAFVATPGQGAILAMGLSAQSPEDFLSLSDTVTVVAPDTVQFQQPLDPANDPGRTLRVVQGGGSQTTKGQARGLYTIAAVSASGNTATLTGPDLGPVSVSGTTLTCTQVVAPLSYPDDLGRQIVLSGSAAGNDATYTIVALIADDGVTKLCGPKSGPVPVRAAVLDRAVEEPEAALSATLLPNLGSGQAQVVVSGATTLPDLTGATVTLTPRTPLPFSDVPYVALTDTVLSAQVFDGVGPINHLIDAGPPATFVIWPFYINDPTNVVSTYLKDMVAAGVTLKVMAGTEHAR